MKGRTWLAAALAAAFAVGIGLVASSRVSAQEPAVRIDSLTAGVEQLAKVELEALDIAPPGLGAWTVNIRYDPSAVSVVACTANSSGICNPEYGEDTVRVTGTSAFGLPGDVLLASIGLVCKAPGESDLALSVSVFADATVGGPQPIEHAVVHGSVTCTEEPQPTSTPTGEPKATPPASELKLPGDANCDGVVNAIDATFVLQYDAGLIDEVPCPDDADYNHEDGVNPIDATLILQEDAGLI